MSAETRSCDSLDARQLQIIWSDPAWVAVLVLSGQRLIGMSAHGVMQGSLLVVVDALDAIQRYRKAKTVRATASSAEC